MIRLTGMSSGLDTDAMVKELVSAYTKKGESNVKEKTKFEWKTEIWKDLNKEIKSFNSKVRSLQFSSSFNQKKTVSSDENRVSVIADEKAVKGTQTIEVKELASTAYVTSKELKVLGADGKATNQGVKGSSKLSDLGITSSDGKLNVTVNGKTTSISANKDTTIDTFVSALKATGLDVSFDEGNSRLFISAKNSGEAGNFTFEGDDAIKALGLTDATGGSVQTGKDAEISLNGATFKSSSNSFSINGMAISVKGKTAEGEKITLTTDTDTDAIYNSIKGIVKEYSTLINKLDKLYNAASASKYEPLTDDEKDAMSDDEIEKWETKIKDSLLRRDSNLSAVVNAMTNASAEGYTVNKKQYTLSDFGINTLGYFDSEDNEKHALHIAGDEDDDAVSGQTNKLKQMIATDPEAVGEFFAKYMTSIADKFNNITRSTSNRSYGNFYDDKKIKEDLTKYEKKISDYEEYVNDIEDKYYKQFTEMEYQMTKLNSTQSQLSNYFS